MNFYPIFLREMLIFKGRLLRVGYLFSNMITPLLYLITFGLGLGRGISIEGISYLMFVVPGICAMSSMTNSYTWIATSISVGRLHFKTFDEYQVSPVSATDIMLGEVLSGVVRGLFASSLILIAGAIFGVGFPQSPIFLLILVLNCLIFACFGVISGFWAKSHEDTSTFSNFFIMPMAFFCGTFFPIDKLPEFIKGFLYFLPLTHASNALRASFLGQEVNLISVGIMFAIFAVCFYWGVVTIRRSNR
ncbi:ABC transporter [Candidatus Desantisbacteria bacterium CG_4_9_14_3_um_filter_40_11]|uniref:Transport permease protein n=4 Tax=unclassified Candidatus Desantisiibacteriota TaxID=3106372 RepID=A0A2M7JBW6_9BACT|nr:MAG: ABC transporter [Candidatus Desantisbacteria bacterium CG23_combo_of_CG06-09_8_20_14_all_40_23]PIX16888.1 MAG: ABC transporter [Candidatus Desantisbacteria bacterium CG_4_8_14_3_um_filter_40_12]PIY18895.1 MAG: ABC transporter [Candidatus Desantisbacteria bacterium CG_4_10_14_3_um_filter_40_18]PJB29142.1 MAG: ABC transporter [Candidatus Desantisbacteria bacterium CG_4_9_14_3_um_filter_40_11]